MKTRRRKPTKAEREKMKRRMNRTRLRNLARLEALAETSLQGILASGVWATGAEIDAYHWANLAREFARALFFTRGGP